MPESTNELFITTTISGLFCPEVIEENGYHYYTCFQFAQLEMILTLRKIGLSIEEIREYASSPSDDSFSRIMEKRKLWIEESIQQLLSEQSFLEQKAERLKIAMNAKHGSIQLCSLPQQKFLFLLPLRENMMRRIFQLLLIFLFS